MDEVVLFGADLPAGHLGTTGVDVYRCYEGWVKERGVSDRAKVNMWILMEYVRTFIGLDDISDGQEDKLTVTQKYPVGIKGDFAHYLNSSFLRDM